MAQQTAFRANLHNRKFSTQLAIAGAMLLQTALGAFIPTRTFAEQPKEITNSIGMKLVLLPPGKVRPIREIEEYVASLRKERNKAKAKNGQPPKKERPKPVGQASSGNGVQTPQVPIGSGLYLGAFEVTREQYGRFREEIRKRVFHEENIDKARIEAETAEHNLPIGNVFWLEAVAFCRFLSDLPEEKAAGRVYRLPTAAEWQYACSAGSSSRYCFGDSAELLDEYAWFGGNSSGRLHAVGQKKANAWGLFDMHGNALEWCQDLVQNEAPPAGIAPREYGEWIARRMQVMRASGIKAPNPNPMRAIGGAPPYFSAEHHTSTEIHSHHGEMVVGWKGEFMWYGASFNEVGFRVAMTTSELNSDTNAGASGSSGKPSNGQSK